MSDFRCATPNCDYFAAGAGVTLPTCPQCGAANPGYAGPSLDPSVTTTEAAPSTTYGWRLTLPNHARVPLPKGAVKVGRGRDVPASIAGVLQLFPDVSREHLALNVTDQMVRIEFIADAGPPVALFEISGPDATPESFQKATRELKRMKFHILEPGKTVVLKLGQTCFIQIDRGEA